MIMADIKKFYKLSQTFTQLGEHFLSSTKTSSLQTSFLKRPKFDEAIVTFRSYLRGRADGHKSLRGQIVHSLTLVYEPPLVGSKLRKLCSHRPIRHREARSLIVATHLKLSALPNRPRGSKTHATFRTLYAIRASDGLMSGEDEPLWRQTEAITY